MEKKRSAPPPSRRKRARPAPPTERQVQATLEDIRRIIGVDAQPVGSVLPEAVTQATEERGTALAVALEPAVVRAIRTVASREPEWLGEILSPTIGTAVKKAVRTAISALMQRLNETLDRSLSIRSIRWRLEAHRTGRPFAEVVLLRTLLYRVEQVFLIHAETGLVLQHVAAEEASSTDPDQVASMLSAIDAFGKEALEPNAPGAYLREFALGDLRVWIDRGPAIAVAIVVRGHPPRSLLELIAETRERIFLEQRAELAKFVADVTPFAATRPQLEACLREQRAAPPRRGPAIFAVIGAVVLALVLAVPVRGYVRGREEAQQLSTYRDLLDAEPGIVVTGAERHDGRYLLSGLRDPIAADPRKLLDRAGSPRAELAFEPYYSLEPRLIERRFRHLASPPAGVAVQVTDSTLRLRGTAPRAWIDRALPLASALPGVQRVDAALTDTSALELASTIRALEALEVRFEAGASRLAPEATGAVERATELIERVDALAAELRRTGCVIVLGDADATGSARQNERLAVARARSVLAAVREARPELAADRLHAAIRSVAEPGMRARVVRFQVRTLPAGGACREGDEE